MDIQENINEYVEEEFSKTFTTTQLYADLSKDFDVISFKKNLDLIQALSRKTTPREWIGKRINYVRPYYYILKLLENNPKEIFDIGCGWNIFKKYIPNIVGYDLNMSYADKRIYIDPNSLQKLKESTESAMSICAMHFCPLEDLENAINDFMSIIKPKGRGYLALNLLRMVERTSDAEKMKLFNKIDPSIDDYEYYIRKTLKKINCKYLVVDVDITPIDEFLNGNISIVFEKE